MNGSNLEQYLGKTISLYVKFNYEQIVEEHEYMLDLMQHDGQLPMCQSCTKRVLALDNVGCIICSVEDCDNIINCNKCEWYGSFDCPECTIRFKELHKGNDCNVLQCPCQWMFCEEHTDTYYCELCSTPVCMLHNIGYAKRGCQKCLNKKRTKIH